MDTGNVTRCDQSAKTIAENTRKLGTSLGWLRLLAAIAATVHAASFASAETLDDWIGENRSEITQLYKELHQTPELSFQEEKTAARMAAELRELGFSVTARVGGHGVVGVLKNGDGKTLLLRADMDALPVAEQTDLPYASTVRIRDKRGATVGVMHACGHDMHMTNLVGALRYLSSHREQWQGTLVAMFQPAEERGAGAQAMLDDGLFVRFPRPDFAMALHVSSELPAGALGYLAGYALANVDSVDIEILGRGGHGAHPHTTIDPVVIAARLVLDLQTIVAREINPIDPAVVTVGSIHGGTKHNIIGDRCHLQITVRSYSPKVRKQLIAAIRRKALAAAASAAGPEPKISVSEGTPALLNDADLVARLVPIFKRALGKKNVTETKPSMGGEDFGRLGRAGVPILMLRLGAIDPVRFREYEKQGVPAPSLHSPKFFPAPEQTITTGITTLVTATLELLKD